jgi:non-specific serine/threonine protein kinase
MKGQYIIVYNLYAFTEGLYLPNAYIVSLDREGRPAHIERKASLPVLPSYQLENSPAVKTLFDAIQKLDPELLSAKFSPPRKRSKPLTVLMADEDIKPLLLKHVHRLLDQWLQLVTQLQQPLTWEVERRVLVKDFLVEQPRRSLEPQLFFRKDPTGIRYRLRLTGRKGLGPLYQHRIIPITNHPAWLLVDNALCRANHINGNMVKPFLTKEEVVIPQKAVKTYFQKFILKLAGKTDIDTEGFDVVLRNRLISCRLQPVQHLFNNRWVLAVYMNYGGVQFAWNEDRQQRSNLDFGDGDGIDIIKYQRDPAAEKPFLEALQNFQLINHEGSYFDLSTPGEDDYELLEWLAGRRTELENEGFELVLPEFQGEEIVLATPEITWGVDQDNDWFDIKGIVQVGKFEIPFAEFTPYIREENRLFPLPDGRYFVIPLEWFSRFAGLAQFAQRSEGALRLTKGQYPLLEALGGAAPAAPAPEEHFELPAGLRAKLRPYQLEGFQWMASLYQQELGACLADDMGLGKTLQTIAVLLYAKERREKDRKSGAGAAQLSLFHNNQDLDFLKPLNALIVLPASLVFNWEQELQKFAPSLTVYRHTGPKRYQDARLLTRFDVLLTTYQTALRDVDLLKKMEFEYIVLDESQQIKNKDSKVFKAVNQLTGKHKITLSGTPIENSLSDLWAQMQFINPDLLGNFNFFKKAFIRPIEKLGDEGQKEQLRTLVKPYLLRRTKMEVAKDLPELSTKVFYSEMTAEQQKLYEREKSKARNYLLENFDAQLPQFKFMVLQSLTKLRQIANHPQLAVTDYGKDSGKFQDVLEHWEVIRRGGHKALFFSSFVKHLELFRSQFESQKQSFAWLTGDQSGNQRQAAIEQFDRDQQTQAFLISMKAGGTGLNLTAADYVFILDPWWNPTAEQQAIARAHRIGQEQHVIAIKFITKDSIEEKILKLQEKKLQLAEDIISGSSTASFSREDLAYLLA